MAAAHVQDYSTELLSSTRSGARLFIVGDVHREAPYANLDKGEKTIDQGIQGYYVADGANKSKFVSHPAAYSIDTGDGDEVVNLKQKNGPLSIGRFARAIDRHMSRKIARLERHPDCKHIEVEGNHARWPEYEIALKKATEGRESQLEQHPEFYKIADALFIHGDRAMDPKSYDVKPPVPGNYDIDSHRYKASREEVYRRPVAQWFHDVGNRVLPPLLGKTIHRPEKCAEKIFEWCASYDAKHPGRPSILTGVKHIFFGHDHSELLASPQVHPNITDPETGKPKVFLFSNMGANLLTLGWEFFRGEASEKGQEFFNPLSVFLNTRNADDKNAKIVEIISFTHPERGWTAEAVPAFVPEYVKQESRRPARGKVLNVA